VTGTLWTDRITLADPATEVVSTYKSGDHAGRPAVTLRRTGAGSAAYVSTRLGPGGLGVLLPRLLETASVRPELPPELRGLVELAVRTDGTDDFWFLINRTDEHVDLSAVSGRPLHGPSLVGPRQVRVLRRPC
ncbi:MAG: beta-galactosidase, partial [Nonomuraea sp.]|nr:beta-galactosidase [Nonomuraea sp.]